MEDTICAISTPIGVGGISIIRVSGDEAISKVSSIFHGKDLNNVESHTISYGHIVDKNEVIDEVLVSIMRAPKTYTMEDVVEINLHGGIATTNRVLSMLIERGVRLAEPGEFTKRAFLNGRLDLAQAEAVNDVINAESDSARGLSINQLSGILSNMIRDMKKSLLEIEANIEVNIDYPEYEDIEDMTESKVYKILKELNTKMDKMIEESKNGKIIKTGINVALIGKPNVGKSSILNAFLEEDKAIVTDIAGTTRDIVEGKTMLNGIVLNFIDTAGIRDTSDTVEKIGVDKSLKVMYDADLVIFVIDNTTDLDNDEKKLLDSISDKKHIIFVNKNDLNSSKRTDLGEDVIYGNTISNDGLDSLKKKIKDMFMINDIKGKDLSIVTNARQLGLLSKAHESVVSAINACESGMPVDIIEVDITNARNYLGEILGESYNDELIDELFRRFCLGK